ncbi:hypothetical protein GGP51_003115 [Salinibacter ruber]|uniref:Transposase n=1 Tax=Salinibacter ruber TaxID=146919 RepID=A0A9X2Z5C8_9BACT|nr:hypothetical protein [Salinibacter ruber]MCS4191619.1 hypothetical protein [Salinibacter ruber]
MSHVREIIGEHPQRGSYYGYRRILPELEERTGQTVNPLYTTKKNGSGPVEVRKLLIAS